MRRRHHDQHRRFTDRNVADPMDEGHSTHCSPLLAHLGDHLPQCGENRFFVGLIGQSLHAFATFRMIPGRAGKHHDGTTRWHHCPVVGLACLERLVRQLDQGVSTIDELACIHGLSVSEWLDTTVKSTVTNLPTMSANEGDDSSGEIFFNPPLPMYERSWRHPSEMAAYTETETIGQRTMRKVVVATAAMSLVMSVLLVAVLLPARPSRQPTATFADASLTTSERAFDLSSEASKFGYLEGTEVAVAAMSSSGYLVTSLTDPVNGDAVKIRAVDDTLVTAIVVAHEHDLGITWLHVVDESSGEYVPLGPPLNVPKKQIVSFSRGSRVWVQTTPSQVQEAEVGIASDANRQLVPIDPNSRPELIDRGPAFDDEGNFVGWCVERDGSTWMVPLAVLEERLLRLESGVE